MDIIGITCRFCLTTDEDGNFKPITENSVVVKKAEEMFKLERTDPIQDSIICKQCEDAVNKAHEVFNRMLDADDYFAFFSGKKKIPQPSNEQVPEDQTVKPKALPKTIKKSQKMSKPKSQIIFECDNCKKSFTSMEQLNEHLANHHHFTCFFCKESFASSEDRSQHLITHQQHKLHLTMIKEVPSAYRPTV